MALSAEKAWIALLGLPAAFSSSLTPSRACSSVLKTQTIYTHTVYYQYDFTIHCLHQQVFAIPGTLAQEETTCKMRLLNFPVGGIKELCTPQESLTPLLSSNPELFLYQNL